MKITSPDNKFLHWLLEQKPDTLLYRFLPNALMEILSGYFRLTVEGEEHLPQSGPAIIAPNHSGYSGFDAMILSHQVYKMSGRHLRVLTHRLWFSTRFSARVANKLGFVRANLENGRKVLRKHQLLGIFPEGEYGNFKPTWKAYDLQEFKTGIIRLALESGAPIVPALVIGAEETHINLRQFKFAKKWGGLILPLPLNLFPLPARWKIKFLHPVRLPYGPSKADDKELIEELAEELRERMQDELKRELANRKSVYL